MNSSLTILVDFSCSIGNIACVNIYIHLTSAPLETLMYMQAPQHCYSTYVFLNRFFLHLFKQNIQS